LRVLQRRVLVAHKAVEAWLRRLQELVVRRS
jgi:hypothetical protein